MLRFVRLLLLALCVSLTLPCPARAETVLPALPQLLTLDDALHVALARNRDVIAAKLGVSAAEVERVAAGVLPNPQLSYSMGNLVLGQGTLNCVNSPSGNPNAPNQTCAEEGTATNLVHMVGVSWELEIWGKRALRIDVAKLGIEAARAAGVFAMEAMWTRFNPGIVEARRLVESGEIGELRAMQGDLIAYRAFDASDRLFAADLGGGAVLDLGVYVLSLAQYFMGTPTVVHAHGGTYSTGVEGEFGALVGYPDGRTATLAAAFTARGPGRMMLVGTDGWIDLHPRFHRGPALTLWRGSESETLRFDSGYHYQVIHAGECIDAGLTESPVMPLSDTQEVQQLMAEVLNQIHS